MAHDSAGTSADQQDPEHTTREMTILQTFREQLYAEDILHDGDTVGTDDETLLYALTPLAALNNCTDYNCPTASSVAGGHRDLQEIPPRPEI